MNNTIVTFTICVNEVYSIINDMGLYCVIIKVSVTLIFLKTVTSAILYLMFLVKNCVYSELLVWVSLFWVILA